MGGRKFHRDAPLGHAQSSGTAEVPHLLLKLVVRCSWGVSEGDQAGFEMVGAVEVADDEFAVVNINAADGAIIEHEPGSEVMRGLAPGLPTNP